MRQPFTNTYQYMGLGALLGAAAALFASAIISRNDRLSGYLRHSGEGAGDTESSIQQHDEKMFRDEVSNAKA